MTYTIKTHPDGTEYIEQDLGNGVKAIFAKDPANSDYQRYLNPEAEQSTPIVIDEAEAK
jgi:hypothetical protein